jgi:tight adherence protein B
MSPILFLIGVMLTGAFAGVGIYTYQRVNYGPSNVRRRIMPASEGMSLRSRSVLRDRAGRIPFVDRLPLSAESREIMSVELERAGQQLRVSEYLALRLGFALVFAFGAFLAVSALGVHDIVGMVAALAMMVVAWMVPRWYIERKRQKRKIAIEEALPEALTAMSKSLRAGSGLFQSLSYAAAETEGPLGEELQRTLDDLRLGVEPEDAFQHLAERADSVDLDIVATAIVIQRTVGGNLSEILNNVNNTIHERVKIQREVRVLTASQRLMSNLVAALPVGVAVLFVAVNPDVGKLLFTTTVGLIALVAALCFELFGLWLVRRLSVVEV